MHFLHRRWEYEQVDGLYKKLLLITGWLISLFCLAQTSAFGSITRITGSVVIALLLLGLLSGVLVFLLFLSGASVKPAVYGICSFFCLPAVAAESKLDWVEKVWKVKLESRLPGVLTGFLVCFVAILFMVSHYIDGFEDNSLLWLRKGAVDEDVREVFTERTREMLYAAGVIAVILLIVLTAGFALIHVQASWEPPLLVLAGAVIVSMGLFYWVWRNNRDKRT